LDTLLIQAVQQYVSHEFIWITELYKYGGHVTMFSPLFTIACCLVVGLGLGIGLDLVSGL